MSQLVGVIDIQPERYNGDGRTCPYCQTRFETRKVRTWPCLSLQDLLKRGLGRFYRPPAQSDLCMCCGWSSDSVDHGLCLDCKDTMQEMGPEAFAKYIEYISAGE